MKKNSIDNFDAVASGRFYNNLIARLNKNMVSIKKQKPSLNMEMKAATH